MFCKRCGGKLYEEEIFTADDDVTYMQIGCYNCPNKIYCSLKKWNKFKRDLQKDILRIKREKNERSKAAKKQALSSS